jgi:hypothetical protein
MKMSPSLMKISPGAAAIPKLASELLIYTIEYDNPKFITAIQVTTFSQPS